MRPPSLRRRRRPPAPPLLAAVLAFAFLSSFVNTQQLCSNPSYPTLSNNLCCAPTPAGCTLTAGSVGTTPDPAKNSFVCAYGAAGTYTLAVPSSTTLAVDVIGGNGQDGPLLSGVLASTGGAGGRITGYINSGTTYTAGMTIMVGAGTASGALLAGAGGGFSSIGTCATLSSTSTCPQIVAGGGGGGGTILAVGGRGGFPSSSSPSPAFPATAGGGLGSGAFGSSTSMSGAIPSGLAGAGSGGGGRKGGGAGVAVPLVGLGSGGGGTSFSTYPIVTVATGLRDAGTGTKTSGPSVSVSFTADCMAPVMSGRARQKRQEEIKKAEKALLAVMPCPPDQRACAFPSGEWECVEFGELRSCGGCVRDHTGVDCLALPGVGNIQCFQDECIASSCLPGYTLTGHGKCLKLPSAAHKLGGGTTTGKKKKSGKKKKKKKASAEGGSKTATGAAGQASKQVTLQ